jgi:hypothetical protein
LRQLLVRASNSRSVLRGVVMPLSSLMASSACSVPIMPTTGPTMPAVRQLRCGSSLSGHRQR